jgi:hypothetical protein
MSGDYDGDGVDDLCKTFNDNGAGSIDVHLSNGSSAFTMARWATQQGGYWETQQWMSGNFDGLGGDDVAKVFSDYGSASIDVHVSSGSSFTMQRWATRTAAFEDRQKWIAGDYNGDGKTDIAGIFYDDVYANIDVYISSGSGFTKQRWGTHQGWLWDTQKWMAGDFDGNGTDDLMKVFLDEGGLATMDVHLSSGNGFSMNRWATRSGSFADSQYWLTGYFDGNSSADVAALHRGN